jgi:hypothetical protein
LEVGSWKSEVGSWTLSVFRKRPTSNDQRPTTNVQRPTTNAQRLTRDGQRPATCPHAPPHRHPRTARSLAPAVDGLHADGGGGRGDAGGGADAVVGSSGRDARRHGVDDVPVPVVDSAPVRPLRGRARLGGSDQRRTPRRHAGAPVPDPPLPDRHPAGETRGIGAHGVARSPGDSAGPRHRAADRRSDGRRTGPKRRGAAGRPRPRPRHRAVGLRPIPRKPPFPPPRSRTHARLGPRPRRPRPRHPARRRDRLRPLPDRNRPSQSRPDPGAVGLLRVRGRPRDASGGDRRRNS